jgi:heavy metal efflux system protein
LIHKALDKLIAYSIYHRKIISIAAIIFMILGFIAFKTLPMEAYPDFTPPRVRVITILPGKGAEEVERLVTLPLEKEMNGIPKQVSLRSISIFGLSVITVTFEDGTASQFGRQQVLERLRQADLPDIAKPQLDPDASPISEIYRYTLDSKDYTQMSLKTQQDWVLEKAFRQIPGVIDVTSFGGPLKTYQINIDPGRLKALNLSVTQVFEAISLSNGTTGGNYIENNGQAYIVRGLGLLHNQDEIGDIVIQASSSGKPIRVKDISTTSVGSGIRLGQVGKNNDDDVVEGIVMMRRGENPDQVIQRLYAKFPEIQKMLPTGIRLTPLYDRMELVRRTLETIGDNIIHGILLVFLVLLLFMLDLRSALIAASVIPLALLFSFLLLNLFHIPANLLSLGAVDFGIIVDGTVVMVEHIFRKLSEKGQALKPEGRIHLVLEAAIEVGKPIFFATIIIVSAFLPIFAFNGVAGKLFHPLAFTMNFALLGALLMTLTIIPVFCAFFLTGHPVKERKNILMLGLEKGYRFVLIHCLRHAWITIGFTSLLLVLSLFQFTRLGSEFLPNLDEGNIWLRVTVLPTSISLEKSVGIARQIRNRLGAYPEVKNIISQIGSPDDGTDANLASNIEFLVDLHPAKKWRKQWREVKEKLVESMDQNLESIPGINTTFSQYIQDNVDEAIAGAKGQVALKLYGPDLGTLQKTGDRLATVLESINGMVDVASDQLLGQPQYRIILNREQASRYGINEHDLSDLVETAIGGKVATQLVEGERRFNVLLRFDKSYRSNEDRLKEALVVSPSGQMIPLAEIASITSSTGAGTILRSDNSRLITVKANVRGRDLGSAVSEAQEKVRQKIVIPEGYRLVWGGQFENQQIANQRLLVAIPITILLIFGILYLNFQKTRESLIALSPILLTAIGGIFALYLTHTYFSVSAGVGFIAAAGVAVQNGVILLSSMKHLEQTFTCRNRAVLLGAKERLRPVIMAGMVAVLGLLPAALSNGIGSQSQKPFAIAIIGGVSVATLLSLIMTPVLFRLLIHFDREKLKRQQRSVSHD